MARKVEVNERPDESILSILLWLGYTDGKWDGRTAKRVYEGECKGVAWRAHSETDELIH